MKVLFLNHTQPVCGVYQFGKRVYELAKNSATVEYVYRELESSDEYISYLSQEKPDVVLYNWYPVTMGWLSEEMVIRNKDVKHFFLFHDGHIRQNFDKYIFSGAEGKDIILTKEKTSMIPRPLFEYKGDYPENETVTIGSFGFGGWQKGFTSLVERVNYQFSKAIINIQMPFAYFGDRYGNETRKIADQCRQLNINSNIELNIDHTFLSNEDTLRFLAGNDLNVFMYQSQNQGLSSVIDYALSVKRPIAITNDSMFKHIYKPELDVNNRSLKKLVITDYPQEFYDKWNPNNFSKEMDKIYAD